MRCVPYGVGENLITFIVFSAFSFIYNSSLNGIAKTSVCNCMQTRGASWNVDIANRSKPRGEYISNKKKDFGKKDEAGSRERNDKERRDPDKYHHDVYFTFNIK